MNINGPDRVGDRLESAEESLKSLDAFIAKMQPRMNYERLVIDIGQCIQRVLREQHDLMVVLEDELSELRNRS